MPQTVTEVIVVTIAPDSVFGMMDLLGSSPDPSHHSHLEYDSMPLQKRPRIAEGWGAS